MADYDESDFWVESMACSSLGTIPSKTKVWYWDRVTLEKRPAYASDIALLWKQGSAPLTQELDFSNFVCSAALANAIAAREQQSMSAMPKVFVLRALRTMAHLHETEAITISYPELNIASMAVRVTQIERGSLADGECIIQVIEDVFKQALTTYATPPGPGASAGGEVLTTESPSSSPSASPSASASQGTPSGSVSQSPSTSQSTSHSASKSGSPSTSKSGSPSASASS